MIECECVTSFSGFYDRQLLVVEKVELTVKKVTRKSVCITSFRGWSKGDRGKLDSIYFPNRDQERRFEWRWRVRRPRPLTVISDFNNWM